MLVSTKIVSKNILKMSFMSMSWDSSWSSILKLPFSQSHWNNLCRIRIKLTALAHVKQRAMKIYTHMLLHAKTCPLTSPLFNIYTNSKDSHDFSIQPSQTLHATFCLHSCYGQKHCDAQIQNAPPHFISYDTNHSQECMQPLILQPLAITT